MQISDSKNSGFMNDRQGFKQLFKSYYPALCLFASKIVGDSLMSEDIVQEVFVRLYEKSQDFSNEHTLKSFLYTSVKNRCINHIEHNKVIGKHRDFEKQKLIFTNAEINSFIIEEEAHRLIYAAIDELPLQCRNILQLSINGLKNSEIAEELNVSVNTVKTQKKLAYKQLRIKLKDKNPRLRY